MSNLVFISAMLHVILLVIDGIVANCIIQCLNSLHHYVVNNSEHLTFTLIQAHRNCYCMCLFCPYLISGHFFFVGIVLLFHCCHYAFQFQRLLDKEANVMHCVVFVWVCLSQVLGATTHLTTVVSVSEGMLLVKYFCSYILYILWQSIIMKLI